MMGHSAMKEDAIFKVRVTMRAHAIRYDCFYEISESADLFATKVIRWYLHKRGCPVLKLDCFQVQGHSEGSTLH